MGTIVSLQISIFCHQKKKGGGGGYKKKPSIGLRVDTCTAWYKIKNNITSSLDAREHSLSELELQHRTGGRARDAAHALLLST